MPNQLENHDSEVVEVIDENEAAQDQPVEEKDEEQDKATEDQEMADKVED